MRVVVCYAAKSVHPASARIDFPAGHNERSITDAALEGVVPPTSRPAGWHDQAGPVDMPVVSWFLCRFECLVNPGINRIVELILGHAGRDYADTRESSQLQRDFRLAAVGDEAHGGHAHLD